jgi:hypothetical protein
MKEGNCSKVIYSSLLLATLICLLTSSIAFALQQIAGALVILTPVGGSNSTKYGLVNDGMKQLQSI